MRMNLPVRLEIPLYSCFVFIILAGFQLFDETGLGFWKYIMELIITMVVMWLLQKSKLTEKEVPIWVGAFIIMAGFAIGIILNMLIENYA